MQEQFTGGTLSGWNLELSIGSITGSQYQAQPKPDDAGFSFPTMPSGKPGLKVHSGSYYQPQQEGILGFEGGNVINSYTLIKRVNTKGGPVSLKTLCKGNKQTAYLAIHVSTDMQGAGEKVAAAWGTSWKPLTFDLPPGECEIYILCHSSIVGPGSDIAFDEFVLPE